MNSDLYPYEHEYSISQTDTRNTRKKVFVVSTLILVALIFFSNFRVANAANFEALLNREWTNTLPEVRQDEAIHFERKIPTIVPLSANLISLPSFGKIPDIFVSSYVSIGQALYDASQFALDTSARGEEKFGEKLFALSDTVIYSTMKVEEIIAEDLNDSFLALMNGGAASEIYVIQKSLALSNHVLNAIISFENKAGKKLFTFDETVLSSFAFHADASVDENSNQRIEIGNSEKDGQEISSVFPPIPEQGYAHIFSSLNEDLPLALLNSFSGSRQNTIFTLAPLPSQTAFADSHSNAVLDAYLSVGQILLAFSDRVLDAAADLQIAFSQKFSEFSFSLLTGYSNNQTLLSQSVVNLSDTVMNTTVALEAQAGQNLFAFDDAFLSMPVLSTASTIGNVQQQNAQESMQQSAALILSEASSYSPYSATGSNLLAAVGNIFNALGNTFYTTTHSLFNHATNALSLLIKPDISKFLAQVPEPSLIQEPSASTNTSEPVVSNAAAASAANPKSTTIIQNITQVISPPVPSPQKLSSSVFVSNTDLAVALQKLSDQFNARMATFSTSQASGGGGNIQNIYQQIAATQKIDQLSGTDISNPTITGGSITGASISAVSLSADSLSITSAISFSTTTLADLTISTTTAGCAQFSVSGKLFSTGTNCGTGSGGGGSSSVATSTNEVQGQLSYWTTNSGTPAKLGSVATTSLAIDASLSNTGTLGAQIGGTASSLSLNLAHTNTWTVLQNFNYSSSTIYSSFATASTTNLIINNQSFNNLLGSGLVNTAGALSVSGLTTANLASANISQFTNDANYLTSLSGAASSTLLSDNNTYSKNQNFTYSSTTNYSSFVTASTTNLIINNQSFNNLLGSGLSLSSGALTVSNVPLSSLSALAANSIVTTNSSGVLIATGTQLTVGNLLATSTTATSTLTTGGFAIGTSQFVVQQNSGRVGIGTTTPQTTLDLGGQISPIATFSTTPKALISDSASAIAGIEMRNVSTGTSADFRFLISDTANNYVAMFMPGINNNGSLFGQTRGNLTGIIANNQSGATNQRILAIGTINGQDMLFGTNNAERVRVTSLGSVGIGTTTPWRTFSVNGTASFTALPNDNTGYYVCLNTTTYQMSTSTTACGASSIRFKDNVQDLPDARGIESVMSMRPVTFTYKPETHVTSPQIGFIAEEMVNIVPEAVGYDANGLISNIDYSKLTPVLTKAIQELNINLDEIAGAVASSTPASQSFADGFWTNLFGRVATWLADATNNIGDVFATTFHAKQQICVDDQCLNKNDVAALLKIAHGQTASVVTSDDGSSDDPVPPPVVLTDTTTPIITLVGDNPLTIGIGASYIDPGATVTDTNADGGENDNLGIHASVNDGVLGDISSIILDTSTTTSYTITYTAVDGAGNTATTTREVDVVVQ